ncbi:MAG: TIGR00297 family protein [Candidatus Aenigmatarchaeota archaeon]
MYLEVAVCSALAVVTWKRNVLSAPASALAFAMGLLIWVMNGIEWLSVLVSFLIVGYMGTKCHYSEKSSIGVEEGSCRRIENVLGNGTSPLLFALLFMPVAFAGSIATALADTLASEIGVLSSRSRLITTLEKVDPGTNGAVSPLGLLFSVVGASIVAVMGVYLLSTGFVPVFAGGFIGCQIDSVLGAVLERRRIVSKSTVNLIATLSGGSVAYLTFFII